MDSTKIVGEKIKSLRETKEISVAELAVRSGLAEEQIERIDSREPTTERINEVQSKHGWGLGAFGS